jgi:hypothetical protein
VNRGSAILLALTAALTAGAGVALAVAGGDPAADAKAAEFHRLVGGLGGGPAIDLSRCEAAFDPRLCPHCGLETGPVPAGGSFCPHAHAPPP